MKFGFQIVQIYSKQSIPSIIFSFESRKYFFNIPEGFQRFSKEHSVRFQKSSKIFFTQMTTEHLNGIFGFLLTLYENRSAFDVQLYGPPGFSSYLDSIRFLFGSKILTYSACDFANNEKLLGLKTFQAMEKILGLPNFSHVFPVMNQYLRDYQKDYPNDINDAESFLKNRKFFKDENLEIYPLILIPDPSSGGTKSSMCYICKPNQIPGKVNIEKVKALNVPRKFISKIIEQKELTVDGVLYRAQDFQEQHEPSPVMILIDCPGLEYLDSLISQEDLREYFVENRDHNDLKVKAMIHMAPIQVLLDPKYAEFLKKFENECQHIFVNEHLKDTEINFDTSSNKPEEQQSSKEEAEETTDVSREEKMNLKYRHFLLNNLVSKYYPDIFPVLSELQKKQDHTLEDLYPFLAKKNTAQKLVEYVLSPSGQEGFSAVKSSFSKTIELMKYKENPVFVEKLNKVRARVSKNKDNSMNSNTDALKLFENCDPEMVFLGTGSMIPATYRNVSAIYLRFWQQGEVGMLLDCGEGTYFQFMHHYGNEKSRELLKNLSVIFITHVHADHNLGLMTIISEREKILKEENIEKDPIFLVVPQNLAPTIFKYDKVEKLRYRIIYTSHINVRMDDLELNPPKQAKTEQSKFSPKHNQKKKKVGLTDDGDEYEYNEDPDVKKIGSIGDQVSFGNIKLFEEFLNTIGINRFRTIRVKHCPQACAVLIEHKDGWKFVYSGDTRPTEDLVKFAAPVTILVHEATFTDNLIEQAKKKNHSTEGEAIDIGMKMKAWKTVLTHFSQRYKAHQKNSGDKSHKNKASKESVEKELQIIEEKLESEETSKKKVRNEVYYYNKNNVVRVFDHFRTKFSDLHRLPAVSRSLFHIFPEE